MGAGPAWMRRGTQGHVAAPRGPAQRAYVARIYLIYYYYYIYSKRGLQPRLEGEGINPLICRVLYTRHVPIFFSVWGLIPTPYLFQVTWMHAVRRIDGADQYHASIA